MAALGAEDAETHRRERDGVRDRPRLRQRAERDEFRRELADRIGEILRDPQIDPVDERTELRRGSGIRSLQTRNRIRMYRHSPSEPVAQRDSFAVRPVSRERPCGAAW